MELSNAYNVLINSSAHLFMQWIFIKSSLGARTIEVKKIDLILKIIEFIVKRNMSKPQLNLLNSHNHLVMKLMLLLLLFYSCGNLVVVR